MESKKIRCIRCHKNQRLNGTTYCKDCCCEVCKYNPTMPIDGKFCVYCGCGKCDKNPQIVYEKKVYHKLGNYYTCESNGMCLKCHKKHDKSRFIFSDDELKEKGWRYDSEYKNYIDNN